MGNSKVWAWLGKNSSQIGGLAATLTVLTAIIGAGWFVYSWLRPDLLVAVRKVESTAPPDLEDWLFDASEYIMRLPEPPDEASADDDSLGRLRELKASGPLAQERDSIRFRREAPGKLEIDIVNQTDQAIPDIRVRLEFVLLLWGVDLSATFLTRDELDRWSEQLATSDYRTRSIVLPALPSLPPGSAFRIVAYGDFSGLLSDVGYPAISATATGATFKFVDYVEVEDRGAVWLARRADPILVTSFFLLTLMVALFAYAAIDTKASKRARPSLAYEWARAEAKVGRKDCALALLERAVKAGFSDFEKARSDSDFAALVEDDRFKKLLEK